MKRSTYLLLAILFFIILGVAAVLSYVLYDFGRPAVAVPARAYLEVNLSGPLEEIAPPDFWLSLMLGTRPIAVHDVWLNLHKAAGDARIRAVILRLGPLQGEWAKMSELRDAVLEFRRSGKKVYAFIEEAPDFDKEYYLATACDRIVLHPLGWLGVNGIGGAVPFLKGTLDKLGIRAEFEHVEDYKTAYNMFTEKGFTPAHREETEAYLGDVFAEYVRVVAAARGMTEPHFRELLDTAFFQGEKAKTAGLVDDVLYDDELLEAVAAGGPKPMRIPLDQYARVKAVPAGFGGGRRIALIYGVGPILTGESPPQIMGGTTVARWLRTARQDSSIKAIVFRVDSPGGSSVGSDVIGREVLLAKRAKPVVVSMSDVAGSGGYWVAMSAHKIVAQPQTLTGSIGVLAGKFSFAGLYAKIGLTSETIAFGDKAEIFSTFRPFTPEERRTLKTEILWTYDKFVTKVAEGRNMSKEAVHEIGQGRIWTGRQAKERGLVDELGGLSTAIAAAKKLAGIPAEEDVSLVVWPKRRSFWETLFGRPGADFGPVSLPALKKALGTAKLLEEPRVWALMPLAVETR